MARGQAGMENKTFAILKSMGLINMETKKFNLELSQNERVTLMAEALKKAAVGASAYARSLAGLSSTLQDMWQLFREDLLGPTFDSLQKNMGRMVDMILDVRTRVATALHRVGEAVAKSMSKVFGNIVDGLERVGRNWDKIADKFRVMSHSNVGMALGGGAYALQAGVGAAAGAIGGAAAGVMTSVPMAAAGPLTAFAIVFAGLAVVFAVVGAVIGPVITYFSSFASIFSDLAVIFASWWTSIVRIVKAFSPILNFFGAVIWGVFIGLISVLGAGIANILDKLADWAEASRKWMDGIYDLKEGLGSFFSWLAGRVAATLDQTRKQQHRTGAGSIAGFPTVSGYKGFNYPGKPLPVIIKYGTIPVGTPETKKPGFDFRGSKFVIKQDFKNANPDRIAIRMMRDLSKKAEIRTQSNFIPALSRG